MFVLSCVTSQRNFSHLIFSVVAFSQATLPWLFALAAPLSSGIVVEVTPAVSKFQYYFNRRFAQFSKYTYEFCTNALLPLYPSTSSLRVTSIALRFSVKRGSFQLNNQWSLHSHHHWTLNSPETINETNQKVNLKYFYFVLSWRTYTIIISVMYVHLLHY